MSTFKFVKTLGSVIVTGTKLLEIISVSSPLIKEKSNVGSAILVMLIEVKVGVTGNITLLKLLKETILTLSKAILADKSKVVIEGILMFNDVSDSMSIFFNNTF